MSKLVIVGEAPGGKGTEDLPALEGLVGRRLAKMMELPYEEYLETVDRRNIFESPDAGVPWESRKALIRAMQMMSVFPHNGRIVILGKRAAQAFRIAQFDPYHFVSAVRIWSGDTLWMAHVPHPSGRNRLLNDPKERERMGRFLREAWKDATGR